MREAIKDNSWEQKNDLVRRKNVPEELFQSVAIPGEDAVEQNGIVIESNLLHTIGNDVKTLEQIRRSDGEFRRKLRWNLLSRRRT